MAVLVNLIAVLLSAALLGLLVWGGGVLAVAYVVTRPELAPRVLVRPALALLAGAIAYIGLTMLLVMLGSAL